MGNKAEPSKHSWSMASEDSKGNAVLLHELGFRKLQTASFYKVQLKKKLRLKLCCFQRITLCVLSLWLLYHTQQAGPPRCCCHETWHIPSFS